MSKPRCHGRSRPASPHRAGEGGSVTPLVAAACAVMIMLCGGGSLAVSAAVAASRARVAADLSAVAGAGALVTALQDGRPDACGVAAVVAARNGAVLIDCGVDQSVNVSVEVSVMPSTSFPWPAVLGPATARARAGPESEAGRVTGGRDVGGRPSGPRPADRAVTHDA